MGTERSNPYSPPDDGLDRDRRTGSLAAQMLVVALFLVVALRSYRATVYLLVMSPWELARATARWLSPDGLEISWAMTRPFLFLAVASFCVWVYRANRDARLLGAEGLSFSPGWAAAIGFVPVANLIGPYRAVKEIYQASSSSATDPGGWRFVSVPFVIPLWWTVWIFSLAWSLFPYATLTSGSAVWGQALLEVLRAMAASFLILVVRSIERRQSEREASV